MEKLKQKLTDLSVDDKFTMSESDKQVYTIRKIENGNVYCNSNVTGISVIKSEYVFQVHKDVIFLHDLLLKHIPKDCYWSEMDNLTNCPIEFVINAMKELSSKLLKLACEKAEVEIETCMGQKTGGVWVDENSILNVLNNIK